MTTFETEEELASLRDQLVKDGLILPGASISWVGDVAKEGWTSPSREKLKLDDHNKPNALVAA